MNLTIPVYVEAIGDGPGERRYVVRPLFFGQPVREHHSLDRAMTLLAGEVRRVLRELGKDLEHDALAQWTFAPELEFARLDLVLELQRERARCRFLFVTFEAVGRTVAFTPSVPDLWFDVGRGERLENRAAEALTRHFREQERKQEEHFRSPSELSLRGRAWVTPLDIEDFSPAQYVIAADDTRFAWIGGPRAGDGEVELNRVGRCLDRLYPDELERALFREREVEELARLLSDRGRRPVLLLGPPLAGKTAVLHEHVFRKVQARGRAHGFRDHVWLLAPPRLISGMSYVGQWEERLLAILKAADQYDHVLYFDDFLGMYHAGVTANSSLCAAAVLKPFVERRECRLLVEMAPEALRILREQDRGFADLFHVLPVGELTEAQNLRVQLDALRRLEGRHGCRFGLEALPAGLDVLRRHARGLSFPGKGVNFFRRLAVKRKGADVTREHVLEEFHALSGLSLKVLDDRAKLERAAVVEALSARVVGQRAAVEAAADVVAIGKARLNDPERPLASFLFLGPTGVGKTQTAKALAEYLFGDAERLLRFDMNEFVAPGAAARLVGTFANPEGTLTAAVRRQAFAVVLLDEIEKAHPEVFDLLLQVLGEGRLSDALGRTVDFTGAIVILTSNLGVREAAGGIGLQPGDGRAAQVYVRAAERFFRPEFFNRLDRVVPFERIGRADMGRIARLLIQGVLQREGLQRRKCALDIEEQALERVVDLGYDPVLGARALKRAIERRLAQPVADRLAASAPESLTIIRLLEGDPITAHVETLAEAPRAAKPDLSDPEKVLTGVEAVLRRAEERLAPLRPAGVIELRRVTRRDQRYFALRDQVQTVRARAQEIRDGVAAEWARDRGLPSLPSRAQAPRPRDWNCRRSTREAVPGELLAAEEIRDYLRELAGTAVRTGGRLEDWLAELACEAALVDLLASGCEADDSRALVVIEPLHAARRLWGAELANAYRATFQDRLGLVVDHIEYHHAGTWASLVSGHGALALAKLEEGTHLIYPTHENFLPVQVTVLEAPPGADAEVLLAERAAARRRWREAFCAGAAAADANPARLLPVVRVYDEGGMTLDVRTGLLAPTLPPEDALRTFLLAALPPPAELLS
jgi:ATP-dependent Clp protease ATP-binding subunit ClpA